MSLPVSLEAIMKWEPFDDLPKGNEAMSEISQPLPQIELPKAGRVESKFAAEMGKAISPSHDLFRYQGEIVEIRDEPFTDELDRHKLAKGGLAFSPMTPKRMKTWVEQYVVTGTNKTSNGASEFVAQSMRPEVANSLLASPQFEREIPKIHRILDVIVPVKVRNEIKTLRHGFNADQGIYCDPTAPVIVRMDLEEAKRILESILAGFCWKNEQSKTHAIARILTPYARGIMGFGARTPLWIFIANRPRAGKDYLAGVAQIIYLGHAFEDAALGRDSEEIGKRITCALRAGRRQMHFANCQGHIESEKFIQAITAPYWQDRALGSNSAQSDLKLPNEADYSISVNIGATFKADIEPRSRKIYLEFYDENENGRNFPDPYLHETIAENRAQILSAIDTFFQHWINFGMPPGKTAFTSFAKWAEVIGGVMAACGYGDPCLPHEVKDLIGGDLELAAMEAVYSLLFEAKPNGWHDKKEVYQIISENQETNEHLGWFGDLNSDNGGKKRSAQTKAGNTLSKFNKRELKGMVLTIEVAANPSRNKFKISRVKTRNV
jgi:hypothetical protein